VWTGGIGISALGTVPPNNTIVETGGSFHLQCIAHDYWMTKGNYWHIYFSLTSIICRLHAAPWEGAKSESNCTKEYDLKRFSAYRMQYVLMLDVKDVNKTDAGLYICAQPPQPYAALGNLGLVAVVGVVCELLSFFALRQFANN